MRSFSKALKHIVKNLYQITNKYSKTLSNTSTKLTGTPTKTPNWTEARHSLNVKQLNILQRIWKLSENAVENITNFKKPSKSLKNVYVITTFILAYSQTPHKRNTFASINMSSLKHCPKSFKRHVAKPLKSFEKHVWRLQQVFRKTSTNIRKHFNTV